MGISLTRHPGYMRAYVIVARPPAAAVEARVLRETLRTLLQRSGALPAPEAPGTMPPAR